MAENGITAAQRAALLREGVVVLEAELEGPRPHIVVTGAGRERVQTLVEQRFGSHVEIDIASDLPRELRPWRCVGHMEREPARRPHRDRRKLWGERAVQERLRAPAYRRGRAPAPLIRSRHLR